MEHPADYLAERLRQRLAADGRANVLDVEVAVRGRDVFLGGSVATEERRAAVEEVAREELPGHVVHNRLSVARLEEGGGDEVLA